MSLVVNDITKSFSNIQAVRGLSMEVSEGSIFGFLGPNGAGKTTTIRMILDIIRPDSGHITWQGQPVSDVPRRCWGYLPEERGLYTRMTVEDHLVFLGQLYRVPRQKLHSEIDEWLERFQITANRHKPIGELSKGNQQKVQVLGTLLHSPDILLMDEPLSGLDPVNGVMLKEAFLELHRRGKTLIFSTHQMEQVEELCEQIAIINHGEIVVSGSVQEVKRRSGRKIIRLAFANDPEARWLDTVPDVKVVKRRQDYIELALGPTINPTTLLSEAIRRGNDITQFQLDDPSLTDIFVELVGGKSMPDHAQRVSAGTTSISLPSPGVR